MVINFENHQVYCKKKNERFGQSCQDTPLVKIAILGRLIEMGGKMFTICCQPYCGSIMQYDSKYCIQTHLGFACAECSANIKLQTQHKKRSSSCLEVNKNEFICDKHGKKCKASDVYYYGDNVFLCKKHHKTAIAEEVKEHGTFESRNDRIKFIVQKLYEHSENIRKKNQPQLKRKLQMVKYQRRKRQKR